MSGEEERPVDPVGDIEEALKAAHRRWEAPSRPRWVVPRWLYDRLVERYGEKLVQEIGYVVSEGEQR